MQKGELSKGAIYHYFKSKEEIFDAIWSGSLEDCPWYADILSDHNLTGCEKEVLKMNKNLKEDWRLPTLWKWRKPYNQNMLFAMYGPLSAINYV